MKYGTRKKGTPYLRSIAVSHKAVETMVNGTLQPEMTEQSFRERILQRDAGDYEKGRCLVSMESLHSMGNAERTQ